MKGIFTILNYYFSPGRRAAQWPLATAPAAVGDRNLHVATNIDDLRINIDNYGGKSLHNQSHGESFLSLVQNRFRGNGFYILDEPEAALSPMRQLTLLIEINNLVKNNSQFIIATHSPILLAYPDAQIYNLDSGIERIEYAETEQYKLTKNFLDNPNIFIERLFDSDFSTD